MPMRAKRFGFILQDETFWMERQMFFCAHGQQMIRVNAASILAPVMEHCSLSDRTMAVFPENSVHLTPFAANSHSPVTFGTEAASPYPASIFIDLKLVELRPYHRILNLPERWRKKKANGVERFDPLTRKLNLFMDRFAFGDVRHL
jgi:hypothetical protein